MVRTKNFDYVWTNLCKKIFEYEAFTVADVILMDRLGFSPQSWRVWRPKLIEKSNVHLYNFYKGSALTHYCISYDKKSKTWNACAYVQNSVADTG